jgi:hypothetical protein
MIYAPEMLDTLQAAVASAWKGNVYRHMFGAHNPARSNARVLDGTRHASGTNLVIFRQDLAITDFEVIGDEIIAADERN